MVVGDGEGHELVERHAVLGIDVEQDGRCGREAQALLDHLDRDEERCGDLLLGLALHPHILEGAELVQRMKRRAIDILDQRHFLGQDLVVALPRHPDAAEVAANNKEVVSREFLALRPVA